MPSPAEQSKPTTTDLAELSALADGTLEPGRRAEVEAHISASPELSALYERERRVVNALHEARESERAPAALRARIEASRPGKRTVARRRLGYAGALVGALAAIALGVVLVLPSGTPGGPSVSDAAALALRGPVGAAPAPDPAHAAALRQQVGDVYFPDWGASLGWRAAGARTDALGGRQAVTVYYDRNGARIAYTIVAAPALTQPSAHPTWLHGTELRTLTNGGRLVVTWRRDGATCVLSARGVTAAELQKLAAWKVPADPE
jgi:anti-sigma factor RsiW